MPPPDQKSIRRPCLVESFHRLCARGSLAQAVDALPVLARRGIRPDARSLALLLHQCLHARALPLARRVHLHLRLTGLKGALPGLTFLANQVLALHFECRRPGDARKLFERMREKNVFSYNSMLAGYAKLRMLDHARDLFDQMPDGKRDIVSWNTMIAVLARCGSCCEAVELYVRMRRSLNGVFSAYTFSGLLMACHGRTCLAWQVHGQLIVVGHLTNVIISSSLVDVYAKCGCLAEACKLFVEMPVRDVLTWTALVSGYAKSGDLVSARRLFNEMPKKNHFSWTVLISGYAQEGLSHEALGLFFGMVKEGVSPDQFAISSALCACTSISSLIHGKQIHAWVIKTVFRPSAVVLSCLLCLYSKCGSLSEVQHVFNSASCNKRDSVLWDSMIAAYGVHGYGEKSIKLFEEMTSVGAKPNGNTFFVVLTACRHLGLFAKGVQIFDSMVKDHGVYPQEEHYACFVEMLGQAGFFEEAVGRILKTPSRSCILIWDAFLAVCRSDVDVQLVREAAEQFSNPRSQGSAPNDLLPDMYANLGGGVL